MRLVVRSGGEQPEVVVERRDGGWRVDVGEKTFAVDSVASVDGARSLIVDGRQYEVAVRSLGDGRYLVAGDGEVEEVEVLDPLTYLARTSHGSAARSGAARVTAYMPGRVVAVLVDVGDAVAQGQGLVVLEAMKMENEIQAARSGTVRAVLVAPGQAVEGGDPLFEIE